MIRSMLAIVAGYFSIAVLTGFSHLIVSFYLETDLSLTGIENLPQSWAFVLTGLGFIFGLTGGLLTATITKSKGDIEILTFILLMVAIALIDYSMLGDREPLWYLITSAILKIPGIYTGYHLRQKQDLQLEQQKG